MSPDRRVRIRRRARFVATLLTVSIVSGCESAVREQRLSSELMLIDGGSHYIKLRSTAPADQASAALLSSAELLSLVDWTGAL